MSQQQNFRTPQTRFLAGEALRLSPSLLSQIRALLLHDNANTPEAVERWITAAVKE